MLPRTKTPGPTTNEWLSGVGSGVGSGPTEVVPGGLVINGSTREFLRKELAVDKINCIHKHLWWAGRPGNIRPLHRQKMMRRSIVITESPALHLVWFDSTIYIKPMPEYLLDQEFFDTHIHSGTELAKLAYGFLYSYSKLIVHKSDFNIAVESGLLPEGMDWAAWPLFASDIRNIHHSEVNKRYKYGELRLRRLNQIYQVWKWELAYHSVYTQYDHFFTQHFGWLLLLFAYLTIVLTAMQVLLATQYTTKAFASASYWFSVISIFVVALGAFVVLGLFVILFVYNMIVTLRWQHTFRSKLRATAPRVVAGAV